ncbi:MAG: type III pantothenate kinase [Candidatus Neomarinimicrobiota bacterium]
MLLAVDVGNTNVVLALFEGEQLLGSWRLHTQATRTADDWWIAVRRLAAEVQPDLAGVNSVIISSVVPPVGRALTGMCERYLKVEPLLVHAGLPLDLGLDVREPATVGADRICNVMAARETYGAPCVVVDLGTATTYDVIDAAGHFIGGAIAPGVETSARQLFSGAALLSAVDLRVPETAIGRDTESNLQAGIVYGAVDQIDGMLARIRQEAGWKQVTVVVTGGLGAFFAPLLRTTVTSDPDLTVKGLRLIYERCS